MSNVNNVQSKQEKMYENIAAISAELFSSRPVSFYDKHGDDLSGFPGVWNFAVYAAKIFTAAEINFEKTGATFEYLDAILNFATWLAESSELPTESEIKQKAAALISKSAY